MRENDLKRRLAAAAAAFPGRPAIRLRSGAISYAELFERSRALAQAFEAELPIGAAIGIYAQRDLPSLVGILACVLASRPYVPLNPLLPLDRLKSIAAIAQLSAVVFNGESAQHMGALTSEMYAFCVVGDDTGNLDCPGWRGNPAQAAPANDENAATCYITFTSGTTGVPKGVRVLVSNVCAYLDGISEILNLTPEDRCSHFFDLSFDLSAHDIFCTWTAGAELAVLPRKLSMGIVDFVNEHQLTSWFSVPSTASFCDRLGQLAAGAMPSLRLSLFCGEPLPVSLARTFARAAPHSAVWNIYGPTEATIAITAYEITEEAAIDDLAVVPLGWPLRGQRIETASVPEGAELILGGSQVTAGYVNNEEQDKQKFYEDRNGDRWCRTGDIVDLSEDHGLLYLGRIDDQVKINGYRVELQEIDHVLRGAAGTPQVASVTMPSLPGAAADHVIAFVVKPKATPADIRAKCRLSLPSYMVPRRIVVIDSMPLTTSGKIDREALGTIFPNK